MKGALGADDPWEAVSVESLKRTSPTLAEKFNGKSEKVRTGDPVRSAMLSQGTSTNLSSTNDDEYDLVITDPPFGGLLHYSELSEFFYVWLRLALKEKYPAQFSSEFVHKSLEVVANKAREPDDSDAFYQRLLTQCWREASRILKPAGILAFTFHHSEDEPWVAVLESLFEAGSFTWRRPIRSDPTKRRATANSDPRRSNTTSCMSVVNVRKIRHRLAGRECGGKCCKM
ncbi:adenine-specific DNA methylase [Bradyrhizobium sp. GM24.11]